MYIYIYIYTYNVKWLSSFQIYIYIYLFLWKKIEFYKKESNREAIMWGSSLPPFFPFPINVLVFPIVT